MRPTLFSIFCIFVSTSFIRADSVSANPILKIGNKKYFLADLLKRKDLERITVKNDPAYAGKEMQYTAVKASKLFEGVKIHEDEVIQFRCLDGFSAPISKDRILGPEENHSIAYIAIEDPSAKWPTIPGKKEGTTAGPFYLVWLHPELSQIVTDEWPYEVVALEVKGTLQNLYPKIFSSQEKLSSRVVAGRKVFQRSCFACHSINGQGAAQVGPDLNIPMNPTEYFRAAAFKQYIRDPKSVRTWAGSKMPAFTSADLSDRDIDNLVGYLAAMAKEKSTR